MTKQREMKRAFISIYQWIILNNPDDKALTDIISNHIKDELYKLAKTTGLDLVASADELINYLETNLLLAKASAEQGELIDDLKYQDTRAVSTPVIEAIKKVKKEHEQKHRRKI